MDDIHQSMLCLSWNDHMRNISNVFMEQLTTENLVDVTIICEGKFIKAHKMVLSACSPYLHKILTMDNSPDPVIIMNNVKFSDMKLVIDFMYCGQIKVSVEDFKNVVSLAKNLQIKGLSNEQNFIQERSTCAGHSLRQAVNKPNIKNLTSVGRGTHRKKKHFETEPIINCEPIITEDPFTKEIKKEPLDVDEIESSHTVEDSCSNNYEEYQQWSVNEDRKPDKVMLDYLQISSDCPAPTTLEQNASHESGTRDSPSPNGMSPQELSAMYVEKWFKSRRNNEDNRIRRPPNAFMIFSNEWRKKMSKIYPTETSKELCRRLGEMWNSLDQKEKQVFFHAARLADLEHKEKYPGYHYCPQKRKRNQLTSKRPPKMPKIKFTQVFLTGSNNSSTPVLIALDNPEVPFSGSKKLKKKRGDT